MRTPRVSRVTREAIDNFQELREAIEAAKAAVEEELLDIRPPGAFTVKEYCLKTGRSRSTVRESLDKLVDKGTYERLRVTLLDTIGRRTQASMYRKKP